MIVGEKEEPRLNSIPAGWRILRLKWMITELRNGSWGAEPGEREIDLPCIRVADFDRTRLVATSIEPTLRSYNASELRGRLLENGHLLIEKSGGGEKQPVGAVVLFEDDEPAMCSNFLARMVPAQNVDSRFLNYLHASLYFQRISVRSIKQTTGIQNLDSSLYLDEKVGTPPLPTQKAIANFLDRKTAALDALIAKKERLLELLAEKRSALINQAVTKGLDPTVLMKDSGIPWIGEIPAHWDFTRLGLQVSRIGDGLHGTPQYDDDGEYWFINGTNLRNGRIAILEKTRNVSEEQWRKHGVALGTETILLSINGTVGNVARYEGEPVMLGKSAAYINCKHDLNRDFLFYYLHTSCAQTYYQLESPGTTVLNLSLESIRRFPFPLPPGDEQIAICAELARVLGRLSSLIDNCASSRNNLVEYRQALITAAVTGQLEIPAEEPTEA